MTGRVLIVVGALAAAGTAAVRSQAPPERLVTLSASLTETVFALGLGDRVVGVPRSVGWPPAAARLPRVAVGHVPSVEGVVAQRPTHVFGSTKMMPAVIDQLRRAGIAVEVIPGEDDAAGAIERIRALGRSLGRSRAADSLIRVIRIQLDDVAARVAGRARPAVLFVYARGGGYLQVAGTGTGMADLINLAGGRNAINAFDGYRPLTAEAVAASGAEVIVFFSAGLASLGGITGALDLPGVALTPAGRNRRILAFDDVLLGGFGPRMGEAVIALAAALHPGVVTSAP